MYLKSIEVQGFKSFANKIKFEFHNGITGIVGPNGSGKSNVADAVRWVLGEQKVKQLRSSSMQDIIFAGTENRKPQSYAYVALTLDNSDHILNVDFEEVTVARRVYRSGESEYLLNGHVCRLKDVQELFYDTGIGKEGYSIIGQGQIDRILSGKPDERRELFDEAAGIVKFKRRKLTAQKKLESEQKNLVRINDILSELERQVGPLEKQAETARTFLQKREVLKNYDMHLFIRESEEVSVQLKDLEEKQLLASRQKQETEDSYTKACEQYEQIGELLQHLEQQIEDLRKNQTTLSLDSEKAVGEKRLLEEQIQSIHQNSEVYKKRLEVLEEGLKDRKEEYEKEEAKAKQIAEQLYVLDQKKKDLLKSQTKVSDEIAQLQSRIEKHRNYLTDLSIEQTNLKTEKQRFLTMNDQAEIQKSRCHSQLVAEKTDNSGIDENYQNQFRSYERIQTELNELEEKRRTVISKREEWREKYDVSRQKFEASKEEFHRIKSRYESLKNIAERYDGYGNSIRRVMEQKESYPGICGVVADIIKVDKKYELAIETALGGSIQNIVTDNENTAKELIGFLKRKKYGRATFLPLTSVKKPTSVPAEQALEEKGAIGLADSLISIDPVYQGVAASLLGRTLVVDTIEHAIAIQRKFRYRFRAVTLEGDSLQAGGAMTGGAFQNNSNLLSRGRELESLEEQIAALREAAKAERSRMQDISTANELLKEELSELNIRHQELTLSQNTAKVQLDHMKLQKQEQDSRVSKIYDEIKEITVAQRENEQQKLQIEKQLQEALEQEIAIKKQIEEWEAQLEKVSGSELDVGEEVSELSVQISQKEQQLLFSGETTRRLQDTLNETNKEISSIQAYFGNSKTEIERKQKEISRLVSNISKMEEASISFTGSLANIQKEKEQKQREYQTIITRREETTKEITVIEKELYRLDSQIEKANQLLQNRNEHMWQEYELTFRQVKELLNGEQNRDPELKQKIKLLQNEIRSLGNVNVNAIEEYKEVSERYHFMDAQRKDLLEAEKTLEDIISELDSGMRKQFSERFSDIQREFDKAFKELFGGGKGTLELDSQEDVLEAGVSISAHPPGKKLQNMMQLSGGEKALTAIALLFAIQNLKPSPFCLLDEIEAALDDSNVDRYAKYLHQLTKNTQFIVITHRRGTMNAADRLYGITMQEKGVSTLVSVNLIENELDR